MRRLHEDSEAKRAAAEEEAENLAHRLEEKEVALAGVELQASLQPPPVEVGPSAAVRVAGRSRRPRSGPHPAPMPVISRRVARSPAFTTGSHMHPRCGIAAAGATAAGGGRSLAAGPCQPPSRVDAGPGATRGAGAGAAGGQGAPGRRAKQGGGTRGGAGAGSKGTATGTDAPGHALERRPRDGQRHPNDARPAVGNAFQAQTHEAVISRGR